MARFSVERNMIPLTSGTSTLTTVPQNNLLNGNLNFPEKFERFTIGLDRDGVINENLGLVNSPDRFVPIKNSLRAVAIIRSLGHKVCVLYDQPLISQRKITIPEVESINQHMLKLLGEAGCVSIEGIFYNTSTKKEDPYAKPKTGMFTHAENAMPGVKFKGGAYVGDSIEDLLMADRVGAIPVLVLTGNGKKTQAKLKLPIYRMLSPKVKIFDDLLAYALSLV